MNSFLTLFVTFTAIFLALGTVQATPITTLLQSGSPLPMTIPGSPDLSALSSVSPALIPESLTQLLSQLFPSLSPMIPPANTQPDVLVTVDA